MIFRGNRCGIIHNFTMGVDPEGKYYKKLGGGVQWYKMQIKNNVLSICLKLQNKNNQQLSFNGQSISFRLSIKAI